MLDALFAQFTPLTSSAQIALISVLFVITLVLSILAFFRRSPPLDSELTAIRSKADQLEGRLEAAEARIQGNEKQQREDVGKIYDELRMQREAWVKQMQEIQTTVQNEFKAIAKELGRIDGRTER